MCTYIKKFPQQIWRWGELSNFVQLVLKRLGMNKCVRTKSHTESKFSKMSWGLLCTRGIVVVHLYCGFFLGRQMALQQTAKFRTAFFGQFCTNLRKDSVANYAWTWTLFSPSVKRLSVLYEALKPRSSIVRWRHKIRKFAAEIFQNAKKSAAELCQVRVLLRSRLVR